MAVVGHAAIGKIGADGQVLRTRLVIDELRRRLGDERIDVVDTGVGAIGLARGVLDLLKARSNCSDLIVMPGSRGLRVLLPLYQRWKRRAGLGLHCLAIGGWLPRYLTKRPQDMAALRAFDGVYVQSRRMWTELQRMGLENVHVLPNFRRFRHDRPRSGACADPMRFVFLSRVIPEKGVELAVTAIERTNAEHGRTVATLDLWGPVAAHARAWFDDVMRGTGSTIRYRGVLAPNAVQEGLTDYDMMLFPTYYPGEAFPGVILDAMIAGIPVIASDWQDNPEFVEDGSTGLLFSSGDVDGLAARVRWSVEHPNEVMRMKHVAASRADTYHVDAVLPGLLESLGIAPAEPTSRGGPR